MATMKWEIWEQFKVEPRVSVTSDAWDLEVKARLQEYPKLDCEYEAGCVLNLRNKRRIRNMAMHFSSIEAAIEVYEEIRDGKIKNKASAVGMLGQIINDFPGTWLAELAEELRKNL